MEAHNFKKLTLSSKYKLIQEEAELIGNRVYTSYEIKLYSFRNLLVEVWFKMGFHQIYWIEIIDSKRVYDIYGPLVKIKM